MKVLVCFSALCAALVASTAPAAIVTHTFFLEGVTASGGFFAEFPSLDFDFGVPGTVVGVEFELTLEAFDPSWASEAIIFVDGSADGVGDFDAWISEDYGAPDASGVFSYSDSFVVDVTSPAGYVSITAADSFDDDGADPDHIYLAGSFITVTFDDELRIPEPTAAAISGIGLIVGAYVGCHRRRKAEIAA